MEPNATRIIALRDGWTHDPDYRRCYQTEDDVETILSLLDLKPDCTLVDVGCGNGAFSVAAAQRNPGLRVRAFDALHSAVAQCRISAGGLPDVQAAVALAHSIPLPNASVDRVLFRSVLHHIAEPQLVYEEIARLLKPGGLLVLQAPCDDWDGDVAQVLSEMMMLHDNSHRRFYSRPGEIVAGLERVGFSASPHQCWPYEFPFLDDEQAKFVREQRAEQSLRLRPIGAGKWSIEGRWVRILARR